MSELSRIATLEQDVADLRRSVHGVRDRLARIPTASGGEVRGQLNFTDWAQFEGISTPGTPASEKSRIYAKADGKMYCLAPTGTEYDLTYGSGGGGGGIADAEYLVLAFHDQLTAERRLVLSTGLQATDGGANSNYTMSVKQSEIDHGAVGGLGDDDHTQYLNITRHDTTSRHTLGTVVPHDAHANLTGVSADQHHAGFVGLSADSGSASPDGSDLIALSGGNGIATSGSGSAVTIAVDLVDAWSGLEFAGGELRVDQDAAFTWTATHTFQSDVQVAANLDFTGADRLITNAGSYNLTLAPGGDVYLNPTGNAVLPTNALDITLGSIPKKYLAIHAAELWIDTLVAQEVMATIGGRIIVAPTTYLTSDLDAGATTMYTEHNNLAVDDILYMEKSGLVEFLQVAAGPGGTGPYSYTVTRDYESSGTSHDWKAGDALVNTGTMGDGFIDLYSVQGVEAGSSAGPTIVGNVRTGTAYNAWAEHWAIGNLKGVYGYGSDVYGFAAGRYSTSTAWISADATNGIRINYGTTPATKVQIEADGDIFIGEDVSAAATTNIVIFTNAQTYNSESVSAGDFLIGDNSSGKANIFWDKSAGKLQFRGGTTMQCEIGTDGTLLAGGGAVQLDADGISIDSGTDDTNRIKWYDESTLVAWCNAYLAEGMPYLDLEVETASSGAISAIQITADTTGLSNQDCTILMKSGYNSDDAWFGVGVEDYYRLVIHDDIVHVQNADLYVLDGDGMEGNIRYDGTLKSYKNAAVFSVYAFAPLTTPLESASWNGDSYSTTARTLIDLSSVFSAPAGIKAVLMRVTIRDSGSAANDCWIALCPYSTGTGMFVDCGGLADDSYERNVVIVPCNDDGDIYYQIQASGANTMDVWLQVWGYWI